TVEVEVVLENGKTGRAIVPSGASTGEHEAVELRDGDKQHFAGKGVHKAISNINTKIEKVIAGLDVSSQEEIDNKMLDLDHSGNKSELGANATLAVSMAVSVAAANASGKKLFEYLSKFNSSNRGKEFIMPCPMMNVINGGKHAPDGVDFQEFMVMPLGANSFSEAIEIGVETFHALKDILKSKGHVTLVGDEGGFAPKLKSNKEAIDLILEAIEKGGAKPGKDAFIAMDPAVSEIYEDGKYNLKTEGKKLDRDQMITYWEELVAEYPIVSLEDILDEDDWEGWSEATKRLGDKIQIVGDDFFVTNTERLRRGINEGAANSILIKLNQIGTLTETVEAMNLAREHGYSSVISHRSGETEDTFIADFAVAMGTGQIKTGSASRSERVAKYNQLLRIEEYLGDKAVFIGKEALSVSND
ncbi:MAG TPA: phosphopyruvate hydratase, partial [bacterium]|nr:phosphopyruvate hydratase [bacterium]